MCPTCESCGVETEDPGLCQGCWDAKVEADAQAILHARNVTNGKRWRAAHPGYTAAYSRRYNQEHRDERRQYDRRYQQEHRAERRAYQGRWRIQNRDRYRETIGAYRAAHRERINAVQCAYRARQRLSAASLDIGLAGFGCNTRYVQALRTGTGVYVADGRYKSALGPMIALTRTGARE